MCVCVDANGIDCVCVQIMCVRVYANGFSPLHLFIFASNNTLCILHW